MSVQILVVEDEADTRLFLRTLLGSVGYTIVEAASGTEALELLDSVPIDAILLDVSLPDCDGYDISRSIRQHPRHAQTPVILITAVYMTAQDEVRGLMAGADDYVRKPFVNDVLLARLKTLLRARQSELELQQRNYELQLLNKVVLTTSGTLHLPTLLDTALQTLCELMHARAGRLRVFSNMPEALETARGDPPTALPGESVLEIPLRSHGPALGTLVLIGPPPSFQTQSDLLANIGSQLAVAVDRARLYSEVQRDLEIKNLLLREVQHRVRNSLQGIIGLLTLQLATQRQSREATEALHGALQRIKSMASLQKYLTGQPALTISVHQLIQRVTHHTISQVMLEPGSTDFILTGLDADLTDEQAQALGMVVQELVHNAIRHGNPRNPAVEISTSLEGENYRIEVGNRGQPLPADFSFERYASTGLRICRDLIAREFRGDLALEPRAPDEGTIVTITIPAHILRGIRAPVAYPPRVAPAR